MKVTKNNQIVWKYILIFLGLCFVAIVFAINEIRFYAVKVFLSQLGLAILIASAFLCFGGLLGFIFGIPSFLNRNGANENTSLFKYNDNLIEISDWLTKIIVGVGLVEIRKIFSILNRVSSKLGSSFSSQIGTNLVFILIVLFIILGFLTVYYWTRTDFTYILKKVDSDMNIRLSQELTEAALSTNQSIEYVDSQVATESLKNFRDMALKIEKQKPISVLDDLQKGRWGGQKEIGSKSISATVDSSQKRNGLFNLKIEIRDTQIEDNVHNCAVFVHDTFKIQNNVIFGKLKNGCFILNLITYEAFTIGVLFEDGSELELDLNKEKNFPKNFYY